jgi:hypothetical protein
MVGMQFAERRLTIAVPQVAVNHSAYGWGAQSAVYPWRT